MPRRVLFTHNDLDALVAALLTRVAMPDCDVYFCTYDNFPELVAKRAADYGVIWVADLSMRDGSPELEALRAAEADEVRWFDHHASSDDQAWMTTCEIDRSGQRCAADVVADWLVSAGYEIPAPWQTLRDYAHDQDLWIRDLPEAGAFDDILGGMPIQTVFDLLEVDPLRVYQPTPEMAEAARRTAEERELSLALAERTATVIELPDGRRIKSVCAWGSTSEVGDAVGDPDTLVALLDLRGVGRGQIRFSLRTQSKEINAARVAEQMGGGGHPQAAGATVQLELLHALTEAIGAQVRAALEAAEEEV